MTLREARALAVQRHSRALQDNWGKALPQLLDELDALDEQYAAAQTPEAPVKPAARRTTRRKEMT